MTAEPSGLGGQDLERTNSFDWQLASCGNPVMIATHRRSGTHLLIDLLRRQFPALRSWKWPFEPVNRLYLAMGGLARGRTTKAVARKILKRARRPILKTHSLPTFDLQRGGYEAIVEWTRQRGQIIYGMRDCRPVMASMYLYMQSHDRSARVPPSEFLRQTEPLPEFMVPAHAGLSRPAQWAHHVSEWLKQAGVLVVRFEDLIQQPRQSLEAIASHLHESPVWREPLLPAEFHWTLWSRLRQRVLTRPASTAILSPPLPNAGRHWHEIFSHEDEAYIWDEAGDVMTKCGYTRNTATPCAS